jgi:hypothetical protein
VSGSPGKDDRSAKRKESISFNPFGAIGKAVGSGVSIVGSGVSMVGNATKAVGSGVVQGTKVKYHFQHIIQDCMVVPVIKQICRFELGVQC